MILGEKVEVLHPTETGRDALNNPIKKWSTQATVDGVLVAPAATTDLTGSIRPDGDSNKITLHFPKTYQESLRGCRAIVRGGLYEINGDPFAYTPENTPGPWNRPATATRVEG